MSIAVAAGYRECEDITRWRAQNFFYGIRLLPEEKRQAMCAVYAFARRVDDIGDGGLPVPDKLARLDAARRDLTALDDGAADPPLQALADACARFTLPRRALAQLIDGVELDVHGAGFETFDELVGYCRLVAGTVGRLCVAIFGAEDRLRAASLADDLGVAMQLTNIVRDVREDAAMGRIYLPAVDRRACAVGEPLLDAPAVALTALIRLEARRARRWFERGLQLMPMLDPRSRACLLAMTGIYRRILGRIERDPSVVARERISLPAWEKGYVAAVSLARAGAPVAGGVRRLWA